MREIYSIILAAGEGTRMRSSLVKVLHPLWGRPMLHYVLDLCQGLPFKGIIVIVGHQAEKVKEALSGWNVEFVHQEEQLGTAHAVLQVEDRLRGFTGDLLVLSGDAPLLKKETIEELIAFHFREGAAATILTARVENPTGYGRVLRGKTGEVVKVVEEVECNELQRKKNEINAGIYCFSSDPLFRALQEVKASARKGEYYLPEVLPIIKGWGLKVSAHLSPDPEEVLGINTRAELAHAMEVLRLRTLERLMEQGVTLLDPSKTYISDTAIIGRDTVVYPGVFIEERTRIGEACTIYPNCRIQASRIGDRVTILDGSVIVDSEIANDCTIGPYAHFRPGTRLKRKAKVGNFVEVKKSVIGEGSKVPHLTYIGDTTMGDRVNIGAGTITCNYDGFQKHQTIIEDEVFVGSNVNLVAPVKVGKGAIIGAGSTITQEVPSDSLALERSEQVNKEGWAARWRKKRKGKK